MLSQSYIIINTPPSTMVPVMPAKRFRTEQTEILRCKRRADMSHLIGYKPTPPTTVARRNERERNRVKHINKTFQILRQHLPSGREKKKMSKVETLKTAIEYIHQLQDLLDGTADEISLSWETNNTDNCLSPNEHMTRPGERHRLDSADCDYISLDLSPAHSSVSGHASSPGSCTTSPMTMNAAFSFGGQTNACRGRTSETYDASFSPGASSLESCISGDDDMMETDNDDLLSIDDQDLLCISQWLQQQN